MLLPGSAFAQSALSGQVRDPAGRPLSGAQVWVLSEGGEGENDGNRAADAVTGDDGSFTVTGIPPHTGVTLTVCSADASMEPIVLREMPWEPVDLVLQPTGRIAGRITGADGAPVAGASVSLLREPRTWGAACSLTVPLPCDPQSSGRTGADGLFSLTGLKPGVYSLQVQASGFDDNEVRGVRLHAGETMEGIAVRIDPLPEALPRSGVEAVPPEPDPAAPRNRRIAVTADLDPGVAPGAEVRGLVTAVDGEPVPRAMVRVGRTDRLSHETLTRADGSFLLRLEPGTWSVLVQADGYLPISLDPFEVTDRDTEVDLRDLREIRMERTLGLRGQFPGLDPGEVPRVRVKQGRTVREGEADPDGGYAVTGLTPGTWLVDAELHAEGTWNGSRSAVGRVTLRPGETEAVLDLDFELGDLTLTVSAPAGANTLIANLVRPDGSVLYTSGLTESPTVRFDRLRPGTYHLTWSLGEHGEARGEQDVILTGDREVTLAAADQPRSR